jgi:hypothetical protein
MRRMIGLLVVASLVPLTAHPRPPEPGLMPLPPGAYMGPVPPLPPALDRGPESPATRERQ